MAHDQCEVALCEINKVKSRSTNFVDISQILRQLAK